MRIYNNLALIYLFAACAVSAQSAAQDPAQLNVIPKGATKANQYWQHLVIDLTRNPSAGDTIAINMPTGVLVADVDGDGDVAGEISIDNEADSNTGYSSAAGSDSSRIRLVSTTGGKVGPVHVQFPITTDANPASASAVYGLITFSNTGETAIPAGTVSLLYAEPFQLDLAVYSRLFVDGVADTTTNRQGDYYPESSAPIFDVGLPDLVSDRRGSLESSIFAGAAVPFGDSDNGNVVDLVSTFLSIDTTFVSIVDQDALLSGIQPFAVSAGQSGLTLFNTHQAGADSATVGNWLLDLVYFEQSGTDRFDGQSVLATIELVTKDSIGSTEIHVNHLGDRASAFYRDGVIVNPISPAKIGDIEIRPRGQLSGRVRFQGRADHTAEITILLREYNNVSVIDDSLFMATNDVNATKAGVQDSTGIDGSFTLTQIPRGRYHLAVHRDRYLDGQYPNLVIEPGSDITSVDPDLLADGLTEAKFLLGGDVTGYVDSSGTSLPDNEIDQLDIDFVVSFFGQATTPVHAGQLADIDGDSLVWVNDLNLVAANFNTVGVDPVYKPNGSSGLRESRLRVTTESSPRELTVQVAVEEASEVRAYGLRLLFDESALSLNSVVQGDLLGSLHNVLAVSE